MIINFHVQLFLFFTLFNNLNHYIGYMYVYYIPETKDNDTLRKILTLLVLTSAMT